MTQKRDEDVGREKIVHNERVKLRATWYNNVSIAAVVGIVVTLPNSVTFASAPVPQWVPLLLQALLFLFAAGGRFIAHQELQKLR